MQVGIAVDHGGYVLKQAVCESVSRWGYQIKDFGAHEYIPDDDYPDYVFALSNALSRMDIDRGIAVCGSGVGACIAANKVCGIRAGLISDVYSAHQGVEDDDLNMICLGARVVGREYALELIYTFLHAKFTCNQRHLRRINKIKEMENKQR
ncbi:MAG TPA: RpiB/LacA/LacB family sugar-phosphate isomerase [Chitinispirillaceae bacterium]|nr:RpiB/LacA/LacB family sugar-phosphate isomerase [Chitinispirillaceae bacterium]